MADKKVILIISEEAELEGQDHVAKFTKKAAKAENYEAQDLLALARKVPGGVECGPEEIKAAFDKDAAFVFFRANGDMETIMGHVMAAMDRRTMILWTGKTCAWFGGFGTKKGGATQRPVKACDIIPTINYVADIPLTGDEDGAVIYQILKDPNLKAKEISRLKDAVSRMEAAMERAEGHDPWKKHDCS
ncbi:MAG: hypothetical protein MI863_01095 [Desulfobacterales bacterium]|nr:hypothetical protein [Desulfobacterales bacterium]